MRPVMYCGFCTTVVCAPSVCGEEVWKQRPNTQCFIESSFGSLEGPLWRVHRDVEHTGPKGRTTDVKLLQNEILFSSCPTKPTNRFLPELWRWAVLAITAARFIWKGYEMR